MLNIDASGARYRFATAIAVCAIAAAVVVTAQQVPTFRAGVDLIAVDVQVVTGQGLPILGLSAEKFEVSINRKRRRVASADLLRFDEAGSAPSAVPTTMPAFAMSSAADAGRVFILALDTMSFPPGTAHDVMVAAQGFVQTLRESDLVGLFAFPNERPIELTTDHAAIVRDLGRVVERGDNPMSAMNRYQLMPSDIVDLTALRARDPRNPPEDVELIKKINEVCNADRDPDTCRRAVVQDGHAMAAYEEGQVVQRLSALRSMLSGLATSSRRKAVVLISSGILATDRPGGRPDLEDLGVVIGQDAARANATIYTLHVDRRADTTSASSPRRPRPTDNAVRDSAILARPLDQIAGASGGTLLTVVQGGTSAFERILTEMSAYYLLGVEPDEADRDGRPRSLSVKVSGSPRGASVRARAWVVVPRRSLAN